MSIRIILACLVCSICNNIVYASDSIETMLLLAQRNEKPIRVVGIHVPGGEILKVTEETKTFIEYSATHPEALRVYLETNPLTSETALALGLIAEKWAVDILVENIPTSEVEIPDQSDAPINPMASPYEDKDTLLYYCVVHSLSYSTGKTFGRTRRGAYFNPNVKTEWLNWWSQNRADFSFESVKLTSSAQARYNFLQSREERR